MNELSLLYSRNNRLQASLQSAVRHFRNGEDRAGFDDFSNSMEDLESVIDTVRVFGGAEADFDRMLPAVRQLLDCVRNQDVTGITDVLEFTVYPLSKEWMKGRDRV